MLEVVTPRNDGVSCRLCGATFAKPHANEWGLCAQCHDKFDLFNVREFQDTKRTEYRFMAFLARQMVIKAKRVAQGKSVTRCECISTTGQGRFYSGYQCAATAQKTRDGRNVCGSHAKAKEVLFAGEKVPLKYDYLVCALRDAATRNSHFREAMVEALS